MKYWRLCLGVVLLNILGDACPIFSADVRVFVGTYDRDVQTRGIYSAVLDEGVATMSQPERVVDVSNPSFLIFSPDFNMIYAVCGEKEDSLACFQVENGNEKEEVRLTERNRLTNLGRSVCHLALDPAWKNIVTAHYASSEYVLFSLTEEHTLNQETQRMKVGETHSTLGPNNHRQECAHPHGVYFGEKNLFYVPDLGTDKVWVNVLDSEKHAFLPSDPASVSIKAGSGPRHLCFLHDNRFAYLANELSSTVTVLAENSEGDLEEIQTIGTLPEGGTLEKGVNNTASEIALTPDERFLYVSNRGHDSLACYKVMRDGTLTLREIVGVHGKCPRHFAISPSGKYLLVANQETDNLVLFSIHPETGRLVFLSERALPASPVCVLFGEADVHRDAEAELARLVDLKKEAQDTTAGCSEGWKKGKYPWDATLKKVETMPPGQFPEELMLAQISVETLSDLSSMVELGVKMAKRSDLGEDRDFVRRVAFKNVIQHAELIQEILLQRSQKDLKQLAIIPETILENLKTVLEWYPNDAKSNILAGWMSHILSVAGLKETSDEITSSFLVQDEQAKKWLNRGLELAEKESVENRRLLADTYMARAKWVASEKPENALEDIDQAVKLNPALSAEADASLLLLYIHTEKYEKALAVLEQRIADLNQNLDKTTKDGVDGVPLTEEQVKKLEVQRKEGFLKFELLRFEILAKMKKWEQIITEVDVDLKEFPDNESLLQTKYQAFLALGKTEECIAILNVMIDANPLNSALYISRSVLFTMMEKYEEALKDCDLACAVSGETDEVAFSMKVSLLSQLERLSEVEKVLNARLENDPENIGLLMMSAQNQILQDNFQAGLEIAQKVEKMLDDRKAETNAEADIENYILVYGFLANWHMMAGEHATAVTYYERSLALDGVDALVLNNLAWILATSPNEDIRNGKKALELAQKAVALEPLPGYISTLAAAYAELGDFVMALKKIEEGISIATEAKDGLMVENLEKEKTSYLEKKPIRERTETYKK